MGLKHWFRRRPSDADIREELEMHLALRAEHEGFGESAARRRFGNQLQAQEQTRGVWVAQFWDTLSQDASFTWRSLHRSPGFTLTAVLVMAIALGASTALFSVLDRILFRELPYADSERLVSLGYIAPLDAHEFMLDGEYVQLWRPAPEPFASVTVMDSAAQVCDLTEDQPMRLACTRVEANLLRVLGLQVAAGRDFAPEDDVPGAPPVALISYDFWMRRFGGDPATLNQTIQIDGNSRRVVGVLPRDFELPTMEAADVLFTQQLRPYDPAAALGSRTRFLRAFGRLKPGVDAAQALVRIQPVFEQMLKSVPERFRAEVKFVVRSLHERQMGEAKQMAWMLFCATGVLLLIASVNVTNLLLARMAARQREFTVRAALGAGRMRIARLALTEGLTISLMSCGLGAVFAWALLRVFVSLAPRGIPKIEQAAIDLRVCAVAFACALLAGLIASLWPSITAARSRLVSGARALGAIQPWVRFGLVSAQLALTVALLGGAALLLRSLWNFSSAPLAFETRNVLIAPLTLGAAKYPTSTERIAFFEQLLERVNSTPGILSAAMTDSLPPESSTDHMLFTNIYVEGRPPVPEGTGGTVAWRSVTPGYFRTLGIPVVRGRDLDETDVAGAEHSIVINESLAQRLFPNEDPLGQRMGPGRGSPAWYNVVAVVGDTHDSGPAQDPELRYFIVRRGGTSGPLRSSFLVLRTTAGVSESAAYLRELIAIFDPQLPVEIETMDQRLSEIAQRPRFIAWLLAGFAAAALLLAAAGLHGVVSYLVTQRTGDIGVRLALGATPARIARHTAAEAGVWIGCGIAGGLLLAYVGGQLLESQLFGVEVIDPLSWAASLAVLTAAVAIAVLGPALRAARVDPAVALRAE